MNLMKNADTYSKRKALLVFVGSEEEKSYFRTSDENGKGMVESLLVFVVVEVKFDIFRKLLLKT